MIEVDNETNWINHKKLDKQEATIFIALMEEERNRHKREQDEAMKRVLTYKNKLEILFWTLQAKNHEKDIKSIQSTLDYLEIKHDEG